MNFIRKNNIFLKLLRNNCKKFNYINYSKNLNNIKEVLDLKLLSSLLLGKISPEYIKTENYKFVVSEEYDTILKSLHRCKETSFIEQSNDTYEFLRKSNSDFLKIFISKSYNGIGKNYSNFAFLIESFKSNTYLSYIAIVNQLLCSQAFSIYGSETQKSKYLPKMTSGEYMGSFCLNESTSGNNIHLMEGRAEYCSEKSMLKVSASKHWIYNARSMDFCILFVKIKNQNGADCLSAFVVDKPLEISNIHISPVENLLNISNVYNVIFDNAEFPADLLGNIGDGFKIAAQLQNSARFGVAASLLGITKEALCAFSTNNDLSSSDDCRKMVNWSSKVFGVESGLYFTTNMADSHPDSIFGIENATLKVHASETAFEVINGCIEATRKSHQNLEFYLNLLNKARGLELFLGSSDVLRLFIGGQSLKTCIPEISDDLYKINHIADHVMWKIKFSKVKSYPHQYVECRLNDNFTAVQDCLNFLKKELIVSLSEFGFNSPNHDYLICKLASCLIYSYHLLAVCGRYQLMGADKLNQETVTLVENCMKDLRICLIDSIGKDHDRMSLYVSNSKYNAISKTALKNKVHGVESALTRNW